MTMQLRMTFSNHSYELLFGQQLLPEIGKKVSKLWQPQRVLLVSDTHVGPLYKQQVTDSLTTAGFQVYYYEIPAGEGSKNFQQFEQLQEYLGALGFTRKDGLIALGGGVVGDLVGFVASTYMRGIHFIQVPTSLLAQVDSSIGGKTGINSQAGKNLVGSFWQPDLVVIDVDVLDTLPERRFLEGFGEIIKIAIIRDTGLWELLQAYPVKGSQKQKKQELMQLIYQSCVNKKEVVEADEREQGQRKFLNFGHTIGHGLEKILGYGTLYHGEAVAIGMHMMTKISVKQGITQPGVLEELERLLNKYQLPTWVTDNYETKELLAAIRHDKKAEKDQVTCVMVTQIGESQLENLSFELLESYL